MSLKERQKSCQGEESVNIFGAIYPIEKSVEDVLLGIIDRIIAIRDEVLTVPEVSRIFMVKVGPILNEIYSKRMPGYRGGLHIQSRLLVLKSDLIRYVWSKK